MQAHVLHAPVSYTVLVPQSTPTSNGNYGLRLPLTPVAGCGQLALRFTTATKTLVNKATSGQSARFPAMVSPPAGLKCYLGRLEDWLS